MRFLRLIPFLAFYIYDVVQSNFRVAHDVLTPRHRLKPGFVGLDIRGMSDRQVVLMANLITMTPGTLGIAVSPDQKRLFIHAMYIDGSPAELAAELERNYGRKVRRVF